MSKLLASHLPTPMEGCAWLEVTWLCPQCETWNTRMHVSPPFARRFKRNNVDVLIVRCGTCRRESEVTLRQVIPS